MRRSHSLRISVSHCLLAYFLLCGRNRSEPKLSFFFLAVCVGVVLSWTPFFYCFHKVFNIPTQNVIMWSQRFLARGSAAFKKSSQISFQQYTRFGNNKYSKLSTPLTLGFLGFLFGSGVDYDAVRYNLHSFDFFVCLLVFVLFCFDFGSFIFCVIFFASIAILRNCLFLYSTLLHCILCVGLQ